MSTRIRGELFNQLSEAARQHDRPLGHEVEQRLEQSFAERTVPPQFAALGELFARALYETASLIGGVNRVARRESAARMNDAYIYDQGCRAVIALLEAGRPPGDPAPHGACARLTNGDTDEEGQPMGHLIGERIAAGFIEVLAGRHADEGTREALWLPRVRAQLGDIAARLAAQPEANDYWGLSYTESGRLVIDDAGAIRVPPKDGTDRD